MLMACQSEPPQRFIIHEVNEMEISPGQQHIALVGARLIDGTGNAPFENATILIRNNQIEAVGTKEQVKIDPGVTVVDVTGLTIVPGLIDAHYHNEESLEMAARFLQHGVTAVRDPGEWIEAYDKVRAAGQPIPRLFLTGPHFDAYPPAYPGDAYIVQDSEEARLAVKRFATQGATAFKVYFGLPVGTIKAVCDEAHALGRPVTGHLEIASAIDAINAGLDGIEHITSFGTSLIPVRDAEAYRQQVIGNDDARRRGRYEMWNSIDLTGEKADSLIHFLKRKGTFVSPTLAIYERQFGGNDTVSVVGFRKMVAFTGRLHKGGVQIVVGSHTWVPYAEVGLAYCREMELLQEAGMTPLEIIHAATLRNARFFRIDERLGSIEVGKIADLVVVSGDPLDDIRNMRQVQKVMLNGHWVFSSQE
jgi:imidazolonepropionase-like amidohydrolase